MKTKCSFKTFMFRRISYPGTLTLNNGHLNFESESVYGGEVIIERLSINNIREVKLKNRCFNKSLCILYDNEWYIFHKFQDENYIEMVKCLKNYKYKNH